VQPTRHRCGTAGEVLLPRLMGARFDGVQFLRAEIAKGKERAVGSESRPNSNASNSRTLVLKVHEGLGRATTESSISFPMRTKSYRRTDSQVERPGYLRAGTNADDRHGLNVDRGQESVVAQPLGISERPCVNCRQLRDWKSYNISLLESALTAAK
jgi:hypothetical protein